MGDPLYASPERKELYYMYIMGVREKKKSTKKVGDSRWNFRKVQYGE